MKLIVFLFVCIGEADSSTLVVGVDIEVDTQKVINHKVRVSTKVSVGFFLNIKGP